MKKRALSILLTLAIVFGLLPTVVSAAELPFTDVPNTAWYYNDVKNAVESGLVNGKSATTYAPDDNLTYAEAVKLAACMWMKAMTGSTEFEPSTPWYQSYVDYAKANHIIKKDYDWNGKATRAGYMEIFAAALPETPVTNGMKGLEIINRVPDGAIPDVPENHPQAKSIYALYRAGILQGSDAIHSCKPDDNIKRSEVAAILTRMMDPDKRVSFSMSDAKNLLITKQPKDITASKGKTVSFSVTVNGGNAPYDYQWYTNSAKFRTEAPGSGKINGEVERTLVLNGVDQLSAGEYWCVVTDADGMTAISNEAKLIIEDAALTVTKQPQPLTLKRGITNTLTVAVSGGTAPYSYQWYKDNDTKVEDMESGAAKSRITIKGSDTAELQLSYNMMPSGLTGEYFCMIKDANGNTVFSDAADVSAETQASALTVIKQPQPLALEDNVKESGSLTVAAVGGTAPYSYQWYKEDGTKVVDQEFGAAKKVARISGSDTAELSVWQSQGSLVSGVYYCVIKDANGNSVTSNKAAVTYYTDLSVYVHHKAITIDEGGTATLSVMANGGKAPYTYEWCYTNTGVRIAESDIYSGTKTDTLTIKDPPLTLDGMGYACFVKDADGISLMSSKITLTVKASVPALTITKQPQSAYATEKTGIATFTVAASGGKAPYTYQWYYKSTGANLTESAVYSGTKTSSLTIQNPAMGLSGFAYACYVTDADGKYVSSAPATLTILPAPPSFKATVTNTAKTVKLDGKDFTYIMADYTEPTYVEFSYLATGKGADEASYVIQLANVSDDFKTWINTGVRKENGPATGKISTSLPASGSGSPLKIRLMAKFPDGTTLYSDPVYRIYPLAVRQWTGDNFSMVCIAGGFGPFEIRWDEYNSQNKLVKAVGIDTLDASDSYNGRVHILHGETISNERKANSTLHTKVSSWLGRSKYVCRITDAVGNKIDSRESLYGYESNESYYYGSMWTQWESVNGDISSLEKSTYDIVADTMRNIVDAIKDRLN